MWCANWVKYQTNDFLVLYFGYIIPTCTSVEANTKAFKIDFKEDLYERKMILQCDS